MTDTAAVATAPQSTSPPSDIGGAIAGIARRIRREDFGTGPLASLRRNAPGAVLGQPAFHRLTADLPDEWLRGDAPVRWATLVHAMAIGASLGETPPEKPAGQAFAEARLSEARFSRLMAAEGEGFRDQVVLVARHLHAKAIGFAWRRIGELLLVEGWNEARADTLRFALARSYYGAMARLDRAQTST